MNLENVETEALEQELERRRAKKDTPPPRINPDPDLSRIVTLCETHINEILDGSYHPDDDFEEYLYETVMETYYGKEFWAWRKVMVWG